ncbi:MAG: GNAT family N-acetyltransferase [Cyanobacteria bacterium P01_A01_bin.123]
MQSICRNATPEDYERVLSINRESLPGVALLERDYFEVLIKICEHFRVIEVDSVVAGYIFAMNQDASYDAEEFQWFGHHLSENFLYIDQVAIGQEWRNNGFGRVLYKNLEEHAAKRSASILCPILSSLNLQ